MIYVKAPKVFIFLLAVGDWLSEVRLLLFLTWDNGNVNVGTTANMQCPGSGLYKEAHSYPGQSQNLRVRETCTALYNK